ncbi:hypothetical protein K458DRAFT_405242 [Lentithecium fluviatile CBS 122367]|uniref:Rhodopsin domain-containing protein n=1 Tax=Lentithecium fluviatile CBS 122367 TaxID=1168545 RepID=A0A6G1IYB9_9PLEO|nr:hypothetical protein K458DRAFT_405242 [Lentithecium fluviatile CBS 122367]
MVTTGLLFAPPSLGPTVKITAFTLTAVSTLVVLVRFYCRVWVVGKLKSYDYLIVPAVLLTWGLCVINWFQIKYGSGSYDRAYASDPVKKNRRQAAAVWFSYQLIYPVVPALVKLSILFFYRSIATERNFRFLVHATITFVTASTVGMVLVTAFECPRKPSLAYSEFIFLRRKQYKCLEIRHLYFAQASLNIFSDIVVFILPLPILVKLRMPGHKRVGLLFLFSVGLLVPVAAAFRIQALHLWARAKWTEQRYYGGYVIFWDHIEANTAIICASVPSLQPLFKGLLGRLSQYSRGRVVYYYGEGETAMTFTTIGRRVSRRVDRDVPLDSPMPTYRPQQQKDDGDVENGVVLVREVTEEEEVEIRNRVQAFTIRPPTSTHSHPPKSPARPRDILSSG